MGAVGSSPIIQIAQGMGIKMVSDKGSPISAAQSVIDKLVKDKLEWEDLKVHLDVDNDGSIFNLNACASIDIVRLPPLYFIGKDEALNFLATGRAEGSILDEPLIGPDDPRLDDEERLQSFANYVGHKLGIFSRKLTWMDRMHLRMYVSAIFNQNEKTLNDALSFIILHELGHVKENHSVRKADYKKRLGQAIYVIINILTFGIFRIAALDLQSRKHEKEADRFAYTGLYAKPDGGIHLFKTVEDFKPKGCKETMAYAWSCLSTLGTHGTYGKRRERIEKSLKIAQR